jgi:hypothetical protein
MNTAVRTAVRPDMEIQFNEIVIIESLPVGERKTGTELYQHLTAGNPVPVAVSLFTPQTAEDLFQVLDGLALRAQAGPWVPLIHLEMHGRKDLIATASNERIKWDDLAVPIRHLNVAVKNSIIMVLGVCSGAFMATAAANSPFEAAPFAWLVGPDRKVYDYFLAIGFRAFYAELLASGDFTKAMIALRAHTLPEYTALDTATLFRKSREVYEKTQAQGSVLRQRAKRIFKQRRHALILEYGGNNKARAAVAAKIQDMSPRWDEYYRHFIMADLYPENEHRFPPLQGA